MNDVALRRGLPVIVYGLADGYKTLYTLRVYINIIFMQENLEQNALERREVTVTAKVSLGWESDVHCRQHGCSFYRSFFSEI